MIQAAPMFDSYDRPNFVQIETAEGPLYVMTRAAVIVRSLNAMRCELHTAVGVVPVACSAKSVMDAFTQHRIDTLKAQREQRKRVEAHKKTLGQVPYRYPGGLGDIVNAEMFEYDDEAIFNEEIAVLEATLR